MPPSPRPVSASAARFAASTGPQRSRRPDLRVGAAAIGLDAGHRWQLQSRRLQRIGCVTRDGEVGADID